MSSTRIVTDATKQRVRVGRKVASVLDVATGKATWKRGASSAKRLGESFEGVVDAVWAVNGCASRGHPATKVVRTPQGSRVVFLAKNGVDFSGVLFGHPVAVECKRLPGAASLLGGKDDSTRAEAAWLCAYYAKGGRGGFLVYDPDADDGHGRVYAVVSLAHFEALAVGQPVLLRRRNGAPVVAAWDVRKMTEHSIPTGLAGLEPALPDHPVIGVAVAVDCALRFVARVADCL